MATFDIFNDDAFSVSSLIGTITDIPDVPTKLGDKGIFAQSGISTPTVMIERTGSALKLVKTAARGGVGQTIGRDARKMIPMATSHLPQRDAVMADEVYGVRAFGKETEVEGVQKLVKNVLTKARMNLDLTLEYHRVGALKGKVMDADGVTPIMDIYQTFGMTQTTLGFNINTATSSVDLKAKCQTLKRSVQAKLGGRSMGKVRVICSETWFDKFVGHDKMAAAFERWNGGQFFREDQSTSDFEIFGVVFEIYSGGVVSEAGVETPFIEVDTAYAYPEGVPGMFQQLFTCADYMETVNTQGVPFYAKQERMAFDKGVMIEAQSNPLTFCQLPEAVIKLTTAA